MLTLSTEGQQRIYSMPTSSHFLVAGLHANSYLQDFSAAENQLRAFSHAAKANGPYAQYRLACMLLAECAAALRLFPHPWHWIPLLAHHILFLKRCVTAFTCAPLQGRWPLHRVLGRRLVPLGVCERSS